MAVGLSPEVERVVAENNLVKDVMNGFADDLRRLDHRENEMLANLASRVRILETVESAAKEKMNQDEGGYLELGSQVRNTCPELPDQLRIALASLEKIAAIPGAMSTVDLAYYDALKKKVPEFIEKISKKSTADISASEGDPKSVLFAAETSVTTSLPSGISSSCSDGDEVCTVSSWYSSASTDFSGYETATSTAPPCPSWENTIVIPSSAAVEPTQMDSSSSKSS